MKPRLFVSILIAVAGCVALTALDHTAYASWAERITLTLVFVAAIVMVLRNARSGP